MSFDDTEYEIPAVGGFLLHSEYKLEPHDADRLRHLFRRNDAQRIEATIRALQHRFDRLDGRYRQ